METIRTFDKEAAAFAKGIRRFVKEYEEDVNYARRWSQRQGRSPDWPWNRFLHAFATNGGSRHWEDQIEPNLHEYQWRTLVRLSNDHRKERLVRVTNPRRRLRKGKPWFTAYLEKIFHRIKQTGGLRVIRTKYNAIKTPKGRIEFWKSFPGIGDKFAREIPMGSYDKMFRNHFALDERIKTLLRIFLGRTLSYSQGEAFLNKVAAHLHIDCWSLDRTLYQAYEEIKRDFELGR